MRSAERWLARSARKHPDRTALISDARAWSFAELESNSRRVARELKAHGLAPGARIAIAAQNGFGWIETLHAAMAVGSPLLPLNTRLGAHELKHPIALGQPGIVVYDRSFEARIREATRDVAVPLVCSDELKAAQSPRNDRADELLEEIDLDREHALLFTSGTTGPAKGVVLTHENQLASAEASRAHLGSRPDDRWLLCLPLFHVGGMAIPLRASIDAQCVVVHQSFDAEAVAKALFEEQITLISMVPTMLHRLLQVLPSAPPALRCALIGGGPIPEALLEAAAERGIPVAPTYGLTESASQAATGTPGDQRLGVPPLPGTEIEIRDPEGKGVGTGHAGEVCIRGPQVMRGYLNDTEATAHTLRSGWLHTGDIGLVDAAGRLHLLDRRDDLIVSGGENVYPSEIEAVLLRHPRLRDAAVVGESDPEWGQRVVAHVVLEAASSSDEGDLEAHCRAQLAGFKVPRRFYFRDQLPRSAGGKLLRRELRPQQDPS